MITVIPTTTTATTIPTMAMAAATWCSGACIPDMAGVSDLSRRAADPAVFDGWKEMIWPGELKLRIGATRKIHAVLVYSAKPTSAEMSASASTTNGLKSFATEHHAKIWVCISATGEQ